MCSQQRLAQNQARYYLGRMKMYRNLGGLVLAGQGQTQSVDAVLGHGVKETDVPLHPVRHWVHQS